MLSKKKIFIASLWVTIIFGLSQIIRLGSNLVLTRQLEPEIFGIMSIVFVVNFGLVMLTDLGLWSFVVRHKDPENPQMLNAVWTLQVIRSWFLFILVTLVAAAMYFGNIFFPHTFQGVYSNPLLPPLIILSSVGMLVDGYSSMASAIMSRKMELKKIELINLAAQLISVAIMIIWVLIYPTIWALVTGGVISTIIVVVLNYALFPYRHRFAWDKKISIEVYHYSKWIVIASSLTYIFSQGDRLFFGAQISPAMLGVYSIALMLATTITTVIETLSVKIVFPALSSVIHNNREDLKEKYYKVRLHSDLVVFLLVGGLFATSQLIIDILYDSRYIEAGWMLKILLISVIGNTLTAVSSECLSALSITKVRMWVMLVRTIGIIFGLPLAFHFYGFEGSLWALSINVFLPLPILYWTLNKNNVFNLLKELRALPMLGIGYLLGLLLIKFI
ncbi:MAG: oligosaccharide flippase family protein [Marinicellaceae bacterium]